MPCTDLPFTSLDVACHGRHKSHHTHGTQVYTPLVLVATACVAFIPWAAGRSDHKVQPRPDHMCSLTPPDVSLELAMSHRADWLSVLPLAQPALTVPRQVRTLRRRHVCPHRWLR